MALGHQTGMVVQSLDSLGANPDEPPADGVFTQASESDGVAGLSNQTYAAHHLMPRHPRDSIAKTRRSPAFRPMSIGTEGILH